MSNPAGQLLDRILRSPYFRDAEAQSNLLGFICHQTQTGDMTSLREHDIGVAVLGLEPGYDVRDNPIISRLAEDVSIRLKAYFQKEGRKEELRVAIPKGEFRAFFYEADPRQLAEAQAAPTSLQSFWAPYWRPGARNILLHGELPADSMLIPEAYAAVQLALLFDKNGSSIEIIPANALLDKPLPPANIILIGTPQSNPLLARHLSEPLEAAAIVERTAATEDHGIITILAAPHHAGILHTATYVTSEVILDATLSQMPGNGFPLHFRLTLSQTAA